METKNFAALQTSCFLMSSLLAS